MHNMFGFYSFKLGLSMLKMDKVKLQSVLGFKRCWTSLVLNKYH